MFIWIMLHWIMLHEIRDAVSCDLVTLLTSVITADCIHCCCSLWYMIVVVSTAVSLISTMQFAEC